MTDTDFITRHDAQVEYCKLCGICKTPGKKELVENACIQCFPAKNPILEIKAADVVEVVRCEMCQFRGNETHTCAIHGTCVPKDGFCAWGQRRAGNG